MNYKAYHGSNVEIKEFDPAFTGKGNDQYGSGFYFATNKEAATAYGDKITKAIITFENPFILDGNKEPNLDNVFPKNNDEIYRILLHMPSLFNSPEDEEMNPLGDYFAEFWECSFNRHEDYLHFIKRLANEYFSDASLKMLDIFFKDYPTEFRKAIKDVMGYDGIVVNFKDGSSFIIAWFPEQIKVI